VLPGRIERCVPMRLNCYTYVYPNEAIPDSLLTHACFQLAETLSTVDINGRDGAES